MHDFIHVSTAMRSHETPLSKCGLDGKQQIDLSIYCWTGGVVITATSSTII